MSKNIVVCYDGTGNEYGNHNTNVVKLYEAIERDQKQVAFYDPGVGTFYTLGRVLGRKVGALLGKGFGIGLRENLEDGYAYLMEQFEPGDKVFLFGFSRGAFTARALAGMLDHTWLLQRGNKHLLPYASRYYLKQQDIPSGFKETFCHRCDPHFIGIWDTVGSLGLLYARRLKFDVQLHSGVAYGRHAMAIDEKRKKFPVTLWKETRKGKNQDIAQVWFAGVHSDVGGWYDKRGLSDIALGWMLDEAESCGLARKKGWENNLHQDESGMLHRSRTGLWRLWRPAPRLIPDGAKIHQSVFDRRTADSRYQPRIPESHAKVSNRAYDTRPRPDKRHGEPSHHAALQ